MKINSLERWIGCLVLAALGVSRICAAEAQAAPEPPSPPVATDATSSASPPGGTNVFLSATSLPKRAAWQQRLTLGPGDMLNFALYRAPDSGFTEAETARLDVPVGPDGRITYLLARDIIAEGLTIDELRAKVDEALQPYYPGARSIITPAAFRSKRFFVLGAVVNKGVFTMDRPMTVIEALARAGGLETGLDNERTVELADLSRSFLVRNGQRVSLDFERLFQQGDLSQNIAVEPNDYVYVASADANEVYVLGEVMAAGIVRFLPRTTVISAIAARGGFNDIAYKQRVLVVRGSLNRPQTFVVNTSSILAAKEADFKLQARDIVYVHQRPWAKAEDLLHSATVAFLQGMMVQWTSMNVGPFITQPLVH
jgi:protein involved in polysaccharide export with SLBB domain